MKHLKYRFGFTLVELIIVITILAILATIAFVTFTSYTSESRDAQRITTLSQVQKGLEFFFVNSGKYPLPDDIYVTGFYMSGTTPELLTTVGYVKDMVGRVVNIKKTPIDPSSGSYFVYGISANQLKYQIAGTFENTQASAFISTSYASVNQARVLGNYTYPLKLSNKLYSLPSLVFVGTGNLVNNFTGFIIHKSSNIPYSLDGKPFNNTQTFSELANLITGSTGLILTGIEIDSYTDPKLFKGLSSLPINLQALGVSKDIVGVSIFGDPYLTAIAQKPWMCGESIKTIDGTQTYTTITGPDGKCWTSQNMRHGTKLSSASFNPSNNAVLEKWCYSNLDANCDSDGALYSWREAMGINAGDSTTSTEDTAKSVCGQLGENWRLPTALQWSNLQAAGATGWLGNKFSGIISILPGDIDGMQSYVGKGTEGFRWTGTPYDASWGNYKSLTSGSATVVSNGTPKTRGYSVVCIKN